MPRFTFCIKDDSNTTIVISESDLGHFDINQSSNEVAQALKGINAKSQLWLQLSNLHTNKSIP